MVPPPEDHQEQVPFERMVEEFADRIYGVALRITGSASDAEDVVQDTFLAAFRHWTSFRGEAAPSTWLYRIAVNESLMRIRGRRPVTYLDETGYDAPQVADWSEEIHRRAELSELREQLEQGIARLPEDYRVVLVLRDVEGLATAEVAEVLDLSEAAVKSRLHRARALLRQHLATYLQARQ